MFHLNCIGTYLLTSLNKTQNNFLFISINMPHRIPTFFLKTLEIINFSGELLVCNKRIHGSVTQINNIFSKSFLCGVSERSLWTTGPAVCDNVIIV